MDGASGGGAATPGGLIQRRDPDGCRGLGSLIAMRPGPLREAWSNRLTTNPTITTTTAPITLCQRNATGVLKVVHATAPIPAINPTKAPFPVARGTPNARMKTPRIEP